MEGSTYNHNPAESGDTLRDGGEVVEGLLLGAVFVTEVHSLGNEVRGGLDQLLEDVVSGLLGLGDNHNELPLSLQGPVEDLGLQSRRRKVAVKHQEKKVKAIENCFHTDSWISPPILAPASTRALRGPLTISSKVATASPVASEEPAEAGAPPPARASRRPVAASRRATS